MAGRWLERLARGSAVRDLSRRDLLDPAPLADRAERVERLAALAVGAPSGGFTRRQGLKGALAGAALAGPVAAALSAQARGAVCVTVDSGCLRTAEASFRAAVSACTATSERGGLWAEIACRVRANRQLVGERASCRRPNDSRCGPGERCSTASGRCVSASSGAGQEGSAGSSTSQPSGPLAGLCPNDPATGDSLEAARAALEAGANEVNLSPGGCLTYRRTLENGVATFEELSANGKPVFRITRQQNTENYMRDGDQDGFFEVQATRTTGSNPNTLLVAETLSPATQQVVRRERRTKATSTAVVRVVIDHDSGSGLRRSAEYDATPESYASAPAIAADSRACTSDELSKAKDLLKQCMDNGPPCLDRHGLTGLGAELRYFNSQGVKFNCTDDSNSATAEATDAPEKGIFEGSPTILINPFKLEKNLGTDFGRAGTICHELMHYSALGLHNPADLLSPRSRELDPVSACETICFNPPDIATKCHCATCLGTDICDPRCSPYLDCDPDMGARCPCFWNQKWYPKLSECLADCPSGLLCFGFSFCEHLDVSCDGVP
jgi:hypothetical protein